MDSVCRTDWIQVRSVFIGPDLDPNCLRRHHNSEGFYKQNGVNELVGVEGPTRKAKVIWIWGQGLKSHPIVWRIRTCSKMGG